ncbi:MAG: hypothetical protein EAZ55_04120 [Cytophagales bacterium]|nr:MAG: hypothetical protein EAZ55_04120 [Cytophagales bacterium]
MSDTQNQGFFRNIGGGANFTTLALFVLLLISFAVIAFQVYTQSSLKGNYDRQKNQIKDLLSDSAELGRQVFELNQRSDSLQKEADSLLTLKEKLQNSVDSVSKLLYMARSSANSSNAKVAQLQKQLKDLQGKLNEAERKYNEVVSQSAAIAETYKARISELEALLESKDQIIAELQGKTVQLKEDNQRPLRAQGPVAIPGMIRNQKFEANSNNTRVKLVKVNFNLSRSLKQGETLNVKLFDAANTEVAIQTKLDNVNETTKSFMIEVPEDYKFKRGRYTVKIFASDADSGNTQQIDSNTYFDLK